MNTIKSSNTISRVLNEGDRVSNRYITLIKAPISEKNNSEPGNAFDTHGPSGRVAFVAGKRNGNACWRNSAKRRMRELARQVGAPWPGLDVLFMAKRPIMDSSYSKVLEAVEISIEKLGLKDSNIE